MKWTELTDSPCPVARSASLIGDRWTLLILRDCLLGLSRFNEFQKSTDMTRHLLAARLKRLVDAGILAREAYQDRPQRHAYVLTDKGRELAPVLMALRDWGRQHLPVRRAVRSA